jgi:hypothetical protein
MRAELASAATRDLRPADQTHWRATGAVQDWRAAELVLTRPWATPTSGQLDQAGSSGDGQAPPPIRHPLTSEQVTALPRATIAPWAWTGDLKVTRVLFTQNAASLLHTKEIGIRGPFFTRQRQMLAPLIPACRCRPGSKAPVDMGLASQPDRAAAVNRDLIARRAPRPAVAGRLAAGSAGSSLVRKDSDTHLNRQRLPTHREHG